MSSWKSWVCVNGKWATNACVFATEEEAREAGNELLSRWFLPSASEPRPSDEPVNYRFNFETYASERIEAPPQGE